MVNVSERFDSLIITEQVDHKHVCLSQSLALPTQTLLSRTLAPSYQIFSQKNVYNMFTAVCAKNVVILFRRGKTL